MEPRTLQSEIYRISTELSRGPIIIKGYLPEYLTFFLNEYTILLDDSKIIDFCIRMDSFEEIKEQKVILNPKNITVWRVVSSRFNDFLLDLQNISFLEALESFGKDKSEKMFYDRFSLLKSFLVQQSDLKNIMISQVKKFNPDIVILFMIDGLSSLDLTSYMKDHELSATHVLDVLVDTATITSCAFKNLIYGKTDVPISIRFHELGYLPAGFSYWERKDEELTNLLFRGINPCKKISAFDEARNTLRELLSKDRKLYFQMLREGLDSLAHRKREIPNISGEIDKIMEDILEIHDLIIESGKQGIIFGCPDHGILWETTNLKLYERIESYGKTHERYFITRRTPEFLPKSTQEDFIRFSCRNSHIYCARFPFTLKHPRSNSCGVHGGISIEESLVPFIQMEVK